MDYRAGGEALAADPKLKGGGEYPKKASTERCINDAMYNLFSNFPMITSSSGGSWFVYCLLTSTRFNDVIMKMATRYLMRNFEIMILFLYYISFYLPLSFMVRCIII